MKAVAHFRLCTRLDGTKVFQTIQLPYHNCLYGQSSARNYTALRFSVQGFVLVARCRPNCAFPYAAKCTKLTNRRACSTDMNIGQQRPTTL